VADFFLVIKRNDTPALTFFLSVVVVSTIFGVVVHRIFFWSFFFKKRATKKGFLFSFCDTLLSLSA
jgi:hypothetical protein